jgi:hypothetical protein
MSEGANPSRSENLLARLASTADVYVQKFDLARDAALLIEFSGDAYRTASFLDDRLLAPGMKGGWVALDRMIEAARTAQNVRPLHFIFHTGHVGSTLVSRLLDEISGVLPLREPLPLRLLAEAHDVLGRPDSLLSTDRFYTLFDAVLRLAARGYSDSVQVVMKATSTAGRLGPMVLARRPEARAICLNLRAEPYLATLLAGQNSPIDLRGHGPERMRRLQGFGVATVAFHQLSLGEQAAMSWLTETWSQAETAKAGGQRVVMVDFERVLGDVAGEMARIVRHFRIACGADVLSGMARSPALTRYAKAPEHPYSPQLRAQVLADSRARNADEIRKGLAWLEAVARSNAVAAAVMQVNG